MQKVPTDQNWQLTIDRNILIKFFVLIRNFRPKFQFSDQHCVIWLSLTFQGFLAPNLPLAEKKKLKHTFLPKFTRNFLGLYYTVYCWQSHRVTQPPLPMQVGEIFLWPFLINFPTSLARWGIKSNTVDFWKLDVWNLDKQQLRFQTLFSVWNMDAQKLDPSLDHLYHKQFLLQNGLCQFKHLILRQSGLKISDNVWKNECSINRRIPSCPKSRLVQISYIHYTSITL